MGLDPRPQRRGPASVAPARRCAGLTKAVRTVRSSRSDMAQTADLLVKNGTVVTPDATFQADVAITDGKFSAIAASGTLDISAAEEYDATGLHVLPGVIDGHVHFREPGL